MEYSGKVVLITGASSGIGFEAARMLAQKECMVFAAARRVELMEPLKGYGVVPIQMDVTDDQSMRDGVRAVMDARGHIDVLVNNAGYGYFGAIEEVDMAEARRQLEVNVFGLARLCQLVLPVMRKQGRGLIVNTSSIAGKLTLLFGGWYHVSKYSVEALSDSLRMEMKPFGVDVSMIEPGGIKTDWGIIAARHLRESSRGTPYEDMANREADLLHNAYSGNLLSPSRVIAKAIVHAVGSRHPKARYRAGRFAHLAVFLHWLLPARWWDAVIRRFCRIKY